MISLNNWATKAFEKLDKERKGDIHGGQDEN